MSALRTKTRSAAASSQTAGPPILSAGGRFLPENGVSGPVGKQSPRLIENGSNNGDAAAAAQLPSTPAVALPALTGVLETADTKTPAVSYQGENGLTEEVSERVEQRALIAEGFAMLVHGAKSAHRGGRPRIVDEGMKAKIAALMGTGLSMRQAAAFLGITHPTIGKAIDDDPEFKREVDLARSRATLHPLACILRESGKNWKAAIWLLEHLEQVAEREKTPREELEKLMKKSGY